VGASTAEEDCGEGTPSGFCQSGSMTGHWEAGAVKRELGCAPLRPD
jgi:hypothetical protein